MPKKKEQWERGDFQTPPALAESAMALLQRIGIQPKSVVEPTCGKGAFLLAALQTFPEASRFVGLDINKTYIDELRERLALGEASATAESETTGVASEPSDAAPSLQLIHDDAFSFNWTELLAGLPEPIAVIGNPPWVTSADLSVLASRNHPHKSNLHKRRGVDAITGKGNFDVSEWLLLQSISWLTHRKGVVAMLCKTSVARKALQHAWQVQADMPAKIFAVDARRHFGASVEACFFVMRSFIDLTLEPSEKSSRKTSKAFSNVSSKEPSAESYKEFEKTSSADSPADPMLADDSLCEVYSDLEAERPDQTIGLRCGFWLSHTAQFEKWQHLHASDETPNDDRAYQWRSGVKHDCAKIMELRRNEALYTNGLGESVTIEEDYVYPMLKSSDVASAELQYGSKYMLVTQRCVGEETASIREKAPLTYQYLEDHASLLGRRASAIYRNRPPFSIFGVGPYTFAPYKVAISGFYKKLAFQMISPYNDKPVVFDDTVYFLPCQSEAEARFLAGLLNSNPAKEFLASMIFWTEKRPITAELLRRLNLHALSVEMRRESEYLSFAERRNKTQAFDSGSVRSKRRDPTNPTN